MEVAFSLMERGVGTERLHYGAHTRFNARTHCSPVRLWGTHAVQCADAL
jgi:hypothetical protein